MKHFSHINFKCIKYNIKIQQISILLHFETLNIYTKKCCINKFSKPISKIKAI